MHKDLREVWLDPLLKEKASTWIWFYILNLEDFFVCGTRDIWKGKKGIDPQEEHRLGDTNEPCLLSFFLRLFHKAIHPETTISCMLDLEKRMAMHAMQLGKALIDYFLVPYLSIGLAMKIYSVKNHIVPIDQTCTILVKLFKSCSYVWIVVIL